MDAVIEKNSDKTFRNWCYNELVSALSPIFKNLINLTAMKKNVLICKVIIIQSVKKFRLLTVAL